ncbi:hypothetical protein Taro_001874 [Colocasia esculenta]|uniref:Aminotransferase-like plant mobile domain-containing protein n=1 Tax=Colocasia esculenta TaxID=4460 RepID=A0A843TEV9_COLES|nr:hypothetical protein [Colocasia esculenta]
MPQSRGAVDRGHDRVGVSMLTQVRMPQLTPRTITHENISSVDRGFLSCTKGPLETHAPEDGQVDLNLIIKRGGYYQYLRDDGYPKHFPLDEHLFPFIQQLTIDDPDADDATVTAEREQLEWVILSGRDSMLGTCTFSYLSFPPDYPASIQFPDVKQLGFFSSVTDSITKALTIVPAIWEVYGQPKSGYSFSGLSLLPSGSAYTSDDYSQFYLLGHILKETTPSWYDGWSVTSSHRFHLGAIEWLMGVLHHYHDLLDYVGIRHAVTAALYSYPCHAGLLQALAERFNRRFNTFATAEGETSIDLWGFHRISGLPICGGLYEKVCLDDLHRDSSKGTGSYHTPYSLRYLTKVWRDLARAGKDETPSACKSSVRVSLNAWVSFFYNGPFCFHNSFAGDTTSWGDHYQLSVEQEENVSFLPASKNKGWNPRRLPDRTYLAAYLAYWLSTFVVPYGEDGYIRPEVLYQACALADGTRLALAPAALASIFHGLGNLTASPTPRDRAVVLPTHYLSAWAGLLLQGFCQQTHLENISAPLLFLFRNCPNHVSYDQLRNARKALSFLPSKDQAGLNFQHCSWGFRPIAGERPEGMQYFLPGQQEAHPSFYKGWLCNIRPSVLVFRKGTAVILEPYYPNPFARNFGYDQATPPNADFPLSTRLYRGSDRHLVAASWWCYYIQRGPPLGCTLPKAERLGQVDVYYARWWFRHSNVFREQVDRIKEAEEKRLCRVDLPPLAISTTFLKKRFPTVDPSLHGSRRKKEGSQKPPLTEKHAYTGAMKPLERPSISGLKDKQSLSPQKHYSWWLHLLSDCGYPANAALSSPILPDGYTNDLWPHWEQHLKNSIARVGPVEFISQLDNCTHLQDLWDAISKAGKIVKLDPKAVVLPPSFSSIPDAPSDTIVEDADFGVQNDEGIGDMETDDYHPIRDGAPSSDEEDIPAADDPGRAIITSGAEMPGFPTPEEGELSRGRISKRNGSALVGSDPAHPVEGAISGDLEITPPDHLGGELTGAPEQSQLVINTPSQGYEIVEGAIIGEDSDGSGGVATGDVSMVDDTVGSLQTLGAGTDVEASGATCFASHRDDSAPPASQEVTPCVLAEGGLVPVQRPDFPPHGIVWPDDSQTGSEQGIGFLIEPFIRSIRMVIEAEFPPSIDKVCDRMEASTRTYHLMGLPRDPWMAGIDSMWAEVQDLHAKSVRESIDLQIRQLGGDISALESRLADTCMRVTAVGTRQAELASSSAALMDEISLLEQAIERSSIRLAELKPALAVTAEAEKNVTAEMEVLDQERLALEHELAAKQSMLMDLQIQISPSS